ncbi:dihydrolipoamide acetyltransferase family protein [Pseudochelatococcus sp. G4_1912]|uniref:dihydrolipoamide acetyltransferase family protein n=1 Tax=Pseudochelatococcus sp. G4_1912 TaxID=3114288 RepID=UPI0039C75E14
MGEYVIKMPDVGEGIAEAELVEWQVKVGDLVREDMVLAAVMTDKATVEIPSSVNGEVLWLGADLGAKVAIGAPLIRLKVEGDGNVVAGAVAEIAEAPMEAATPAPKQEAVAVAAPVMEKAKPATLAPSRPVASATIAAAPRAEGEKPLASPSVRLRARDAGIDLRQIIGSGPAGRISHEDIDAFIAHGGSQPGGIRSGAPVARTEVEEIKVIGLRRKIAEKMALSKSRIPHIMYAEEVDVTALEELRTTLNRDKKADHPRLTILPFLMRAMVKALAENPQLNARYDDDAGVVHRYAGVHIGIAAQTPAGLVVPVVKHAEARNLWESAIELNRLSDAAKAGTASRDELSGSTITISSLGAIGGIISTPVINYPEVAIIGVNKIAVRPVWDGTAFVPRKIMNLSSSFDHRVIDGWDAAVFIQRLKTLLETPALIFVEG